MEGFSSESCTKSRKPKRSNVSNYERHPVKRLGFKGRVFDSDSTRVHHEALNEIQVEGDKDKEMLNTEDVALDNISASRFATQSSDGSSFTFNGAATRNQQLRETPISRRRARTRTSLDDAFFSTIDKLLEISKDINVELRKMANYFQIKADEAARPSKVFDVVSKIEGLTKEEVTKVGAIIVSDTGKLDCLFHLPDNAKELYVRMLLAGSL